MNNAMSVAGMNQIEPWRIWVVIFDIMTQPQIGAVPEMAEASRLRIDGGSMLARGVPRLRGARRATITSPFFTVGMERTPCRLAENCLPGLQQDTNETRTVSGAIKAQQAIGLLPFLRQFVPHRPQVFDPTVENLDVSRSPIDPTPPKMCSRWRQLYVNRLDRRLRDPGRPEPGRPWPTRLGI